nr:hypothetical protein Iba_chr03aCG2920 [Ipomoea batatas]
MFGNNFLVYLHCLVVSEAVRKLARMEAEDEETRDTDPITDLTTSWFVGGLVWKFSDEVMMVSRMREASVFSSYGNQAAPPKATCKRK